jgi:hypothetical protein
MNKILTQINRTQTISFCIGGLFLILSGLGAAINHREFFISYLFAFFFWFGLSLGCLNVILILNLTGGSWGHGTRRILEAAFMTLPAMAVFFVPILFGLKDLYPWSQPLLVSAGKILRQRAVYENFPGFLSRAIFFFSTWIFIAVRLRQWSLRQDETNSDLPTIKMRTWSGPGIVLVPFTATFAFVDWILSIEPAWFSTAFALILLASQVLGSFAFAIVLLAWFQPHPPFRERVSEKDFLDLGNLLLASVMFWTYVSFSQFLIIYSGNQPHEIDWYLHRIAGGWKWFIGFIALFYFLIPFFSLLFRVVKQNIRLLSIVAAMVFLMRTLEVFWVITPTFHSWGIQVHWTDFVTLLGIGGIWIGVFLANLKRHPFMMKNISPGQKTEIQASHAK